MSDKAPGAVRRPVRIPLPAGWRPEAHHVVMFSGGKGSWLTAKRVAARHGTDSLILLFADTKMEDADLYRFLREAAADVGGDLVVIEEGRDPWQVFHDERFLGNSRIDPCSKILKRLYLRDWLEEHFDPRHTTVYLGIDWTEEHRFTRARKYWEPWSVEAPLCDPAYGELVTSDEMLALMEAEGLHPPRLYEMGFPHNNCGGFCIKAGQAHFKLLLEKMPDRYRYHEQKELELREALDRDVTILKDRRLSARRQAIGVDPDDSSRDDELPPMVPLSLRDFRLRIEGDPSDCDTDEWGGCGCFTP